MIYTALVLAAFVAFADAVPTQSKPSDVMATDDSAEPSLKADLVRKMKHQDVDALGALLANDESSAKKTYSSVLAKLDRGDLEKIADIIAQSPGAQPLNKQFISKQHEHDKSVAENDVQALYCIQGHSCCTGEDKRGTYCLANTHDYECTWSNQHGGFGACAYVCFPKTETVLHADGRTDSIAALSIGDRILATRLSDGSLFYDEVTALSIAKHDASAEFLTLTTANGFDLTLTPTHHVPVGPTFGSDIRMAKHVQPGNVVWVYDRAAGTIAPTTVASIETTFIANSGLYNPLLKHGGLPVVDGVVTAFNTLEKMQFESAVLPYVTTICEATGTCTLFKRAYTATECTLKHADHFLKTGGVSAAPLCKHFTYIDGTAVHAGARFDSASSTSSTVGLGLLASTAMALVASALATKRAARAA